MATQSRIEANAWIKENALPVLGDVLSIGSMSDSDNMGSKYRDYFVNARSYTTSDVEGEVDMVVDVQKMSSIKDGSYECLFVSGVLEHIPDFQSAVTEIHRVLEKNGVVLLGVPFRQSIHSAPHDYWRFTKFGIEEILKERFEINDIIELDKSTDGDFPSAYMVKATKI